MAKKNNKVNVKELSYSGYREHMSNIITKKKMLNESVVKKRIHHKKWKHYRAEETRLRQELMDLIPNNY